MSIKTVPDLYQECTLACLIEVMDKWPSTLCSAAPEVNPECSDYEFVIRAEELRTPKDTPAFHEPSSSTDKNVVDLLSHPACVGIPTQPA